MRGLLLLAILVNALSAWDPGLPTDPVPVKRIELRAVEATFAGIGRCEPGSSVVADAAGSQGLRVLLHRMPARGEHLLPSSDGRYIALVRGEVYDLQNQTLVFRNRELGSPRFWDGDRAVFDKGIIDAAQPGWARVHAGSPHGLSNIDGFWTGQQGRGRSRHYRIAPPAGTSIGRTSGFTTPGYDVCTVEIYPESTGSAAWRYAVAAVDPATLTVLAAYVGPESQAIGLQRGGILDTLLHTLVRDPACTARCPTGQAIACGGFREAVSGSLEDAYWTAERLPDGRFQRIKQKRIPSATLSCRWSDDAQTAITLQADRFTRWSGDWTRLGWVDVLSYGQHTPLAVDGTRLCLRIEGRAVWCDLATLRCADAGPPRDWWLPSIARGGPMPTLVADMGRRRRIPLHPGPVVGKVAVNDLPGERGAWCRDGRMLHVLSGVQAPLRSFDLGDAGPAWLVAPSDGSALAAVFADRIVRLDLAGGTAATVAIDHPLLPTDLPAADSDLAMAVPSRRWPEAVLHVGKELVRVDLLRGTSRRCSMSMLCGLGPVLPADVRCRLTGTLGDGRVALRCERFAAAGAAGWALVVDPDGRMETVRADSCASPHTMDETIPGLLTAMDEDGLLLWRLAGNHVVRVKADVAGAFAVAEDGLVAVPRNLAQAATVVFDGRRAPISAFDLVLNRPDIILERIGFASPATVGLLREAWRRRIVRLGLDPAALRVPTSAAELPAVRILDRPTGLTTSRERLDLRLAIDGAGDRAVRVRARIGSITVAETSVAAGKDGRTGELRGLQLAHGINRIELAPLTAGGLGIPDRLVLRRDGTGGSVRVAALGVSRYREAGRDLQFAAADARDLAAALGGKGLVLTDEAVSRERLPELRAHLAAATLDDLAVIIVAGHGLVDRSMQYRIATFDTAFADPAARSIAVDELLEALRASPARRRLLLIDTCHAGEVEPGEMRDRLARLAPGAGARGLRPATTARPAVPAPASEATPPTPGQVARIQFQDAGSDDGITILAACRGDEASWESPAWGHGAFSAAILEALASRRSDLDGDGAVDLAELGQWLDRRVPELTGGQQHPEVRAGDLDREVVIAPAQAR